MAAQDGEGRSFALTIGELECLGYTVKALGHNPGLEGSFLWTNTHTFESQPFAQASNSEAEVCACAAQTFP